MWDFGVFSWRVWDLCGNWVDLCGDATVLRAEMQMSRRLMDVSELML